MNKQEDYFARLVDIQERGKDNFCFAVVDPIFVQEDGSHPTDETEVDKNIEHCKTSIVWAFTRKAGNVPARDLK
jgi:hypothetical protein